ncbi:FHA domain-containing protein [Verrucomicrobia bacterium]|nr:FHA domain-containing protein [Verrucomicrobiota bacterium]
MSNKSNLALVVQTGIENGKELPIPESGELVAGRGRETDIVVGDQRASRRHARFISENGVAYVEDLGSKNGTFVNGERVEKQSLFPGDLVEIRNLRIRVQLSGGGGLTPEPHGGFGDSSVGTMANAITSDVGPGRLKAMLEFVLNQRKSGSVVLRASWDTGHVFVNQGGIYHVTLDKSADLRPEKALERLFRAETGTLEFNTGPIVKSSKGPEHRIDHEGMSETDSGNLLERLGKEMPFPNAALIVDGRGDDIAKLGEGATEVASLAGGEDGVPGIMDRFSGTDLECAELILKLVEAELASFQKP